MTVLAKALGRPENTIVMKSYLLGGGFGRKSFPDFAVEAAVLAKQTGKPVKVVWSREDDTTHDFYRPMAVNQLSAGLGPDGKPRSLYATIYRTVFDRFADPRLGSLLFALTYLAVWIAVCGLLYRKRIFVKI